MDKILRQEKVKIRKKPESIAIRAIERRMKRPIHLRTRDGYYFSSVVLQTSLTWLKTR